MANEGTVHRTDTIDIPILGDILAAVGQLTTTLEVIMADGKDLRAAIEAMSAAIQTLSAAQQQENATLTTMLARITAIQVQNLTPEQLTQAVTDLQAEAVAAQAVATKLQEDAATAIPS